MARLIFFALLAVAVSTAAAQGNSVCAQWCAANFKTPGAECTSLAAKGTGPCYVCGPLKTSTTQQLCKGACVETNTDNKNCGSCGNVCPSDTACRSGVCRPLSNCNNAEVCGFTPCGGPGQYCWCQPDETGAGFCNIPGLCSDFTDCTTFNDCPVPGSVCLSTCCGGGKCFKPNNICPKLENPSRLFKRRSLDARDGPWTAYTPPSV
ncbi:hypothetical protein GJ744_001826 [Endocarpon pusillum]|uniref:TNFR-Cys domain-containing protein n=1 Tax=Endocarpon pusillum TaxID=364733 RepID=A0A8H7AN79_9EURO|nr:hypothetical protein GJ744_001826 [Endocarpon pusillum]